MEERTGPQPCIWSPLRANSFRVLRINQVEPWIDTQLIERQHGDPFQYYALSYAWGEERLIWNISCQQTAVAVTSHLHEALRCIFNLYGQLDLFVDAICIDQRNIKEKAQQVANMDKVYASATRVLVWLGREEDHSSVAMEYIRSLDYFLPSLSQLENLPGKISLPGRLDELPRLLQAIWKLNLRPWYNRLWVLQEVVLADDFDVICGQSKLSGHSFVRFATAMSKGQFLDHVSKVLHIDMENIDEYEGFAQLSLITLARRKRASRHQNTFAVCVHNSRDRHTKEPVDRIYALLGLDVSEGAYYRKNILVDYSTSTPSNHLKVYIGFAKLALCREGNLFLLHMTSSEKRVEGLPSWCPNFDSPDETYRDFTVQYRAGWPREPALNPNLDNGSVIQGFPMFKGKWENHVTTYATSDKIKVWGCVADTVEIVGQSDVFRSDSRRLMSDRSVNWYQDVMFWLDEMLDLARTVSFTSDQELPDSYWRTLAGDFDISTYISPADPAQVERCGMYRRSLDLMCKQFALTGSLKPTLPALEELMAEEDWRSSFDEYLIHLDRIWLSRAFFTTAAGRTGYASSRVRSGDLICAFYGGPSIYVLRQKPSQDIYEFVDDGFTLGLMHGEAFDLLESGMITEQEFIIE